MGLLLFFFYYFGASVSRVLVLQKTFSSWYAVACSSLLARVAVDQDELAGSIDCYSSIGSSFFINKNNAI